MDKTKLEQFMPDGLAGIENAQACRDKYLELSSKLLVLNSDLTNLRSEFTKIALEVFELGDSGLIVLDVDEVNGVNIVVRIKPLIDFNMRRVKLHIEEKLKYRGIVDYEFIYGLQSIEPNGVKGVGFELNTETTRMIDHNFGNDGFSGITRLADDCTDLEKILCWAAYLNEVSQNVNDLKESLAWIKRSASDEKLNPEIAKRFSSHPE